MSIFEKQSYTTKDILSLIEQAAEETDQLEFKAAQALQNNDKKKNEIGKDVSSFANSAGGILIYGINELDHAAESISFINGKEITKEWLEQVIQGNINRKIPNLKIFPVRFENKLEKTVYVLRIPESENAPHMSRDGKFYKRYNFLAEPMKEYEVRQLYNKLRRSKLSIQEDLRIVQRGNLGPASRPTGIRYDISVMVENTGGIIEQHSKLEMLSPIVLSKGWQMSYEIGKYFIRVEDGYRFYSIPTSATIFQNEIYEFVTFSINVTRYTLSLLENPFHFKFFFSSGMDLKEIKLIDLLEYQGAKLSLETFG